jgi:hypothetical protein
LYWLLFSQRPLLPRTALEKEARSIVATQVLIKANANKKVAAGFLLKLKIHCSSLSDKNNLNQMILHGASMPDLDQDQLHHLQEVNAMFPPLKKLTAEALKIPARQAAAAGTQHLIHLVSQILLGAITRKEPTLVQHLNGMLKTQDSLMTSLQRWKRTSRPTLTSKEVAPLLPLLIITLPEVTTTTTG